MLLLGDNKGRNEMCGFSESFSGTRYCRLCTATSFECQAMCEENPLLLRNKENYDKNVESNNILSGIKERCIFNSLEDFHVAENKTIDLMHDWFEGT